VQPAHSPDLAEVRNKENKEMLLTTKAKPMFSHLAKHNKPRKAMSQSELVRRTCNPRKARENARKSNEERSLIGLKTVYLS